MMNSPGSQHGAGSNSAIRPLLAAAVSCAGMLACALVLLTGGCVTEAPAAKTPLKVLLVTSGGYHDYKTLAPFLTSQLGKFMNATIEAHSGLDVFENPHYADAYDAVIYDVCEDEAPDAVLENVMRTVRAGKPSVMLHCSIHAFRKSPKIGEWEAYCGMRSKVHDAFGPFSVDKVDAASPITQQFPDGWSTPGDELYRTIAIDPQSHQLLKARSPRDGRVHVVAWTFQYGKGRVFCTTLGHDLKTVSAPEYLRLVANGLLWSCDKLNSDGTPAAGYAAVAAP